MTNLRAPAAALVAPGKGILAADESVATATKRLDGVGIASTAESRRAYREMLLTTPGLASWVSGVILFDETMRQATSDGIPFPDYLCDQGKTRVLVNDEKNWTNFYALCNTIRGDKRVTITEVEQIIENNCVVKLKVKYDRKKKFLGIGGK